MFILEADGARLGTVIPDVSRQCPGVDPLDAWNAVTGQIGLHVVLGPPVTRYKGAFPNYEPGHLGTLGLLVHTVDARVADLHRRHDHDLPMIGGVGQDLLVTCHAGVENHLTHRSLS